jgi:hypothetical protein
MLEDFTGKAIIIVVNQRFCGRSSMAEQKLPKLTTLAENRERLSKTRAKNPH